MFRDGRWITSDCHGADGFLPDGTVDSTLLPHTAAVDGAAADVRNMTARQVCDWVGDDGYRAEIAWNAERTRARVRGTVRDWCSRLIYVDA